MREATEKGEQAADKARDQVNAAFVEASGDVMMSSLRTGRNKKSVGPSLPPEHRSRSFKRILLLIFWIQLS